LTQLNTPYPSTAYLTGFLRSRGYEASQADLGIEMILRLFSRPGLGRAFSEIRAAGGTWPGEVLQMLALQAAYLDTIEPVITFLQGHDDMLAAHLARAGALPEGPRFSAARRARGSGRSASALDEARHRATLYIEDLTDLLHHTIAPHLSLNRYAESLVQSAASFDGLYQALQQQPSLTDHLLCDSLWPHVERSKPVLVGLTVPFPGNLVGAFRIAQALKGRYPGIKIALGGGYANTELRRVEDPRVFSYIDFITLDDGERPLLCLLEHLAGRRKVEALCRTFVLEEGKVILRNGCTEPEFAMDELGTPTYHGLPLGQYLSIVDTFNPMHRLWSEGHWNKLTVAHGCYWKQCTFCDVGLDYIGRYEATPTQTLLQRIEALIKETGHRGFHFVDEAAPPAALKQLALGVLERGLTICWWGNIRFEEAFSADLARLLASSGCIALTAGLEAASDRLLQQMKKGITVDQTARVAAALRQAGILVHAYLMYGCPGETIQETVDALERVRQLFHGDLLQSAFWHRFTATAHSPIGLNPSAAGIRILGPSFAGFAENDLRHDDPAGRCPLWLAEGLRSAVMNYMEGRGTTLPVSRWFRHRVPAPLVPRTWLQRALSEGPMSEDRAERRCVWIGSAPILERSRTSRRRVILPTKAEDFVLSLPADEAEWLVTLLREASPEATPGGKEYPRLTDLRSRFPGVGRRTFARFCTTTTWSTARRAGLLLV
jgi:hypothetical protein